MIIFDTPGDNLFTADETRFMLVEFWDAGASAGGGGSGYSITTRPFTFGIGYTIHVGDGTGGSSSQSLVPNDYDTMQSTSSPVSGGSGGQGTINDGLNSSFGGSGNTLAGGSAAGGPEGDFNGVDASGVTGGAAVGDGGAGGDSGINDGASPGGGGGSSGNGGNGLVRMQTLFGSPRTNVAGTTISFDLPVIPGINFLDFDGAGDQSGGFVDTGTWRLTGTTATLSSVDVSISGRLVTFNLTGAIAHGESPVLKYYPVGSFGGGGGPSNHVGLTLNATPIVRFVSDTSTHDTLNVTNNVPAPAPPVPSTIRRYPRYPALAIYPWVM